ncbi:MAG: peptide deformylase, partial [Erysipelotrichaceae bacterium]
AYDLLQDKEITIRAKGYEAIVLQHEIDHFSGIMYYDSIDLENPWKEDSNAMII